MHLSPNRSVLPHERQARLYAQCVRDSRTHLHHYSAQHDRSCRSLRASCVRPGMFDHVALYLLSRNRWTGKVHHTGICIPRHDDSRRRHHPSHPRETCRHRIRGNSELFCGRRTLLCVSRLLRLVCKTFAQQTRSNI